MHEHPEGDPRVIYSHIKDCVERESDLVIKWLTMLILINAGLIAALIQLYGINTGGESLSESGQFALALIICVTGLVASGFIFFAIDASSDQFGYLRQEYESHEEVFKSLKLPRPFGDENSDKETKMFPAELYSFVGRPFVIPLMIAALWLVIMCAIQAWLFAIPLTGILLILFIRKKFRPEPDVEA